MKFILILLIIERDLHICSHLQFNNTELTSAEQQPICQDTLKHSVLHKTLYK